MSPAVGTIDLSGQYAAARYDIPEKVLDITIRPYKISLNRMTKSKRAFPDVRAYLEEIRRQGRTQNEIAAALDISVGYLSDIKAGRYQPALDLAIRIAELANVPIESMVKR